MKLKGYICLPLAFQLPLHERHGFGLRARPSFRAEISKSRRVRICLFQYLGASMVMLFGVFDIDR